jgi:transposase
LTKLGVACDVVAPSLIPVRAGDRMKTDRRDAKKLVSLYRAGLLRFVHPPTADGGGRAQPRARLLPRGQGADRRQSRACLALARKMLKLLPHPARARR